MAQSKVPKFGAWENGEVAYTEYFEVARKGNTGGPMINPNDPQMNRDATHPAPNHSKPNPKHQQQQKQQQQAKFGEWDNGDSVPYTQIFENKGRVTNPNEPRMNRGAGPTQQHSKPPPKQQHQPAKFGAWEGGDEVPYTQIFENKGKAVPNQNQNQNANPKELQMNRDVGPTRQPQEPQPKPQGVKFVDIKPKQAPPAAPRPQNGGKGGASVPVFGVWNNDPTQAGGYTVVFEKLHEDKKNVNNVPNVPNQPTRGNNNNRPPMHNNNRRTPTRPTKQQQQQQQQKQRGCFSWLLG